MEKCNKTLEQENMTLTKKCVEEAIKVLQSVGFGRWDYDAEKTSEKALLSLAKSYLSGEIFMGEEEIGRILKDHYWDSLEKDRGILEKHFECVSHALANKVAKKEEALSKDFIEKHYDEFLGYYYNSPCSGCKGGHSSFWKTIIESPEWEEWEASRPPYDFSECEELGIMGKKHFNDFIKFIRKEVAKPLCYCSDKCGSRDEEGNPMYVPLPKHKERLEVER